MARSLRNEVGSELDDKNENLKAIEHRRANAALLKEGLLFRPSEEKAKAPVPKRVSRSRDHLRDPSIDYNAVRPSKLPGYIPSDDIKRHLQVTQQVQVERRQQLQLARAVETRQQLELNPAQREYKEYKDGFKNLVTIQPAPWNDPRGESDKELEKRFFETHQSQKEVFDKIKKERIISGNHQSRSNSIGYLTFDALNKIAEDPNKFQSGFSLDNMPDGFYLERTNDTWKGNAHRGERMRLVLCYNDSVKNERKNPFTLSLKKPMDPIVIIGTHSQFNVRPTDVDTLIFFRHSRRDKLAVAPDSIIERDLFFEYLDGQSGNCIDKDISKKIRAKYATLLDKHLNAAEFIGLFDVLYWVGCEGVECILAQLETLRTSDLNTFNQFKDSVLLKSENWNEFLKVENQIIIDKIAHLSAEEKLWWNGLVSSHIKHAGNTCLDDLWNCFDNFVTEFKRISKGKALPNLYNLKPVRNIFVVTERIIRFLENAADFDDALKEDLLETDWNSPDIEIALRFRDAMDKPAPFRRIKREMQLHEKIGVSNRSIFVSERKDSFVPVTAEILERASCTVENIQPLIFQYLGIAKFSAPIEMYRTAIPHIMNDYKSLDMEGGLGGNLLLFLVILSTAHKRGYKCDIQKELMRVKGYFQVPNSNLVVYEIHDLLLRANWLSLSELVSLIIISHQWIELQLDNPKCIKQRQDLFDLVEKYGEEFAKHLMIYERNPGKRMDADSFLETVRLIENEFKDDPNVLKKIMRVFSIIRFEEDKPLGEVKEKDDDSFVVVDDKDKLKEVKKFLELIKKLKTTHGQHSFDQILDVLSVLKVKPGEKPPTMKDFILTANGLLGLGRFLHSDIKRCLPHNCDYDTNDCKSSRLVFDDKKIIDDLISALSEKKINVTLFKLKSEVKDFSWFADICRDPVAEPIAKRYIPTLQINQVRTNRMEMKFVVPKGHSNEEESKIIEGYNRDLALITDTLFCPEESPKLVDTLVPMRKHAEQVRVFVEVLTNIQTHWPEAIPGIFERLCNPEWGPKRSLAYVNAFLKPIADYHPTKMPFPFALMTQFQEHENEYVRTYDRSVDETRMAFKSIWQSEIISYQHKEVLIDFNLKIDLLKANPNRIITFLIKHYEKIAPVLVTLTNILSSQCKDKNESQINSLFDDTMKMIDLLSECGGHQFTEQFFKIFEPEVQRKEKKGEKPKLSHAATYHDIIKEILSIPLKVEKPKESKRTAAAPAAPIVEDDIAIHLRSKRHIITQLIFKVCDKKKFTKKDVIEIIKSLATCELDTLKKLLAMTPPPNMSTLKRLKNDVSAKTFIDNRYDYPCYRDLTEQFKSDRILDIVKTLQVIAPGKPLEDDEREDIFRRLMLIHSYGTDDLYSICWDKVDGPVPFKPRKTIDLTNDENEIKKFADRCRHVFNTTDNAKEREQSILIFITLMREAMWRATGKFPYPAQMIPALLAMSTDPENRNILVEIDTSAGKTISSTMVAALAWFMGGGTQHLTTSNSELLETSFEQSQLFFQLLDIPCASKVITEQSDLETDYKHNGINYFDSQDLPLFRAKQKLDKKYMSKDHVITLHSDECDTSSLSSAISYRYAVPSHSIDISWVYPIVNDFVYHSEEFKKRDANYGDDFNNLRMQLLKYAKEVIKDEKVVEYFEDLNDEYLKTWIQNAEDASRLKVDIDYLVIKEFRGRGRDMECVSFARMLEKGFTCTRAELGNGLQQALHAYLNQKEKPIHRYPLDPETISVVCFTDRSVTKDHNKHPKGRVFGCSASAAGSKDEAKEQSENGARIVKIDPHKESKKVTDPTVTLDDEKKQFDYIINQCFPADVPSPLQPILISVGDIKKAERFYDYMLKQLETNPRLKKYKDLATVQLYTAKSTKIDGEVAKITPKDVVSNASMDGWFTISTKLGRGTDIQPDHDDGLRLFLISKMITRETIQNMGRPARDGKKGRAGEAYSQSDSPGQTIEGARKELEDQLTSERLLGNALGDVRDLFQEEFFSILHQGERTPEETSRLFVVWSKCMKQMEDDWRNLTSDKKAEPLDDWISLKAVSKAMPNLEIAKEKLFTKTLDHWNKCSRNKSSPLPERKREDFLKHKALTLPLKKMSDEKKAVSTIKAKPLSKQNVYLDLDYFENAPFLLTAKESEREGAKHFNESCRRSNTATRILGQLLGVTISFVTLGVPIPCAKDLGSDLRRGLLNLFRTHFNAEEVPLSSKIKEIKKILSECFYFVAWSKDEGLKKIFIQSFYKAFFQFVTEKLNELNTDKRKPIVYSRAKQVGINEEAQELVGLLDVIRQKKNEAEGTPHFNNFADLEQLINDCGFYKVNRFSKTNELDDALNLEKAPTNEFLRGSYVVKFDTEVTHLEGGSRISPAERKREGEPDADALRKGSIFKPRPAAPGGSVMRSGAAAAPAAPGS